ncbi:ATP-grasp fold amidoligase family protein [Vibrio cholerae]|uniref:ATP-grasp fold amidoligase family protein n=1 Tax=Vibrio cholerae TaxID=666 RepID=UPI000E0AD430|nr:ATP-grasp fold amidoligase family protein [Vibrio cholerae]
MVTYVSYVLRLLPLHIRIFSYYLFKFGSFPDLNSPKKYSEKIQYRKLNLSEIYTSLSDKVKVKDFISENIGESYLISTIGVFNNVDSIDFDKLPNEFVIKTHFGSGSEHIEIVKNKDLIDINKLKVKFANAMLVPCYKGSLLGEEQYDKIERKILIEEYMSDSISGGISDYKFHLFNNGEDGFLQVDFDRFVCHKRNLYNLNFERLPYDLMYSGGDYQLPNKDSLEEMLDIARKLAIDFDYVRVDLYLINNKIYFGELTFTPGNGFEKFSDPYADEYYGKLWK